MKIEFYEEFPSKQTLKKLEHVDFPTKIFIAAKSLRDFREYENLAKHYKKDVEVAYWPIIKNSYWISPFSNYKDLLAVFNELNQINNSLLIDLELPLVKNFHLYVKNLASFRKNRRMISGFMERNRSRITTAEHPLTFVSKLMGFVGMDLGINCERSIMWYSSKRSRKMNKKVKNELKNNNRKADSVSIGTIASGVIGDEKILPPEKLEEDLDFVKNCGFNKAVIFRLGGLNKDYVSVLRKFAS